MENNLKKNPFYDLSLTFMNDKLFVFIFQAELSNFLAKLWDSDVQRLGTLAFRIDFNGYYSSKSK